MKYLHVWLGTAAAVLLAACGGGGGGDGGPDIPPPPPQLVLTFDPVSSPVRAGSDIAIAVRVATSSGGAVADGVVVTLTVAPTSTALVASTTQNSVFGATAISNVSGGVARFTLRALAAGTATLAASTGSTSGIGAANTTVTIVPAPLPDRLTVSSTSQTLYVQGSGGNGTATLSVALFGASGQPLADGAAGVNNVRVEIVQPTGSGERLSGTNAAGASVGGNVIAIRSRNGVATFELRSGTQPGAAVVRVTVDRADNDVDNGIQSALSAELRVPVSDGRVLDVDILNPDVSVVDRLGGPDELTWVIAARATDRDGNPVLPGTEVEFALIDTQPGGLRIFGNGDPQEGGTAFHDTGFSIVFFVPQQIGHTLMVFGEELPGQRDMESLRRIVGVPTGLQLTVDRAFNRNDGSGVIVDAGPVLPYRVGFAQFGRIASTTPTDADGIARATVVFPASRSGLFIAVGAQASGFSASGSAALVADVEQRRYPFSGPASLTLDPPSLAATTADTRVCVRDALDRPIPGQTVRVEALGSPPPGGLLRVNGSPLPAVLNTSFNADGCVLVNILAEVTRPRELLFRAADAESRFLLADSARPSLAATANRLRVAAGAFTRETTLLLRAVGGAPLGGVPISVTCSSGSYALQATTGTTDADGRLRSTVSGNGFVVDPDGAGPLPARTESAQCVYSVTTDPTIRAVVDVQGVLACSGIVPRPAACP